MFTKTVNLPNITPKSFDGLLFEDNHRNPNNECKNERKRLQALWSMVLHSQVKWGNDAINIDGRWPRAINTNVARTGILQLRISHCITTPSKWNVLITKINYGKNFALGISNSAAAVQRLEFCKAWMDLNSENDLCDIAADPVLQESNLVHL